MVIKKPGEPYKKSRDSRLSDKIKERLNYQIKVEYGASQLYKAAYTWCSYNGLVGTAELMKKHSDEEQSHYNKLYEYLLDKDCMPMVPAIAAPTQDFANLRDVIQKSYEHEKFVTSTYEEFASMALNAKDFTTFTFVQWYLKEQVEEEALFLNILDRIDFMEKEGVGMFEIDEAIGDM